MDKLIVVSNHPIVGWSEEQISGWDISYIPFPNISANASLEALNELRKNVTQRISKIIRDYKVKDETANIFLCIQGDYSFTFLLQNYFAEEFDWEKVKFAFPTTERQTIEELQPDGSVKKTTIFKFVQWRIITRGSLYYPSLKF